jgi:hypothetical protein
MTTAAPGPLRLVVLGDSLAFTDATGPRPPDDPHLWPNVTARALEAALGRPVVMTVLARPGNDVREAVRTVLKDRHAQFDVIAPADAVVVAVGSFDHAPRGTPPVVDALVPHLRPAGLRRRARRLAHDLSPVIVRLTAGRRRRTPRTEFARLFGLLLDQVRGLTWGRAVGVVLGPTSHRSAHYGHTHPLRERTEAEQLALARAHGFRTVASWPLVEPFAADLNPDGIHWPASAHAIVGAEVAQALVRALSEDARVGLPASKDLSAS